MILSLSTLVYKPRIVYAVTKAVVATKPEVLGLDTIVHPTQMVECTMRLIILLTMDVLAAAM